MTFELKTTFNNVVDLYHARRPHYPVALFDKLITATHLSDGAQLLEIGPGTGQATRSLAERGYHITAIELGNALAEKARQVLAEFANVDVITGAFEDADLPDNSFDLVYSATAFHWIAPEVKFARTHKLLRPAGHLAIIHTEHVSDDAGDAFFYASQPLYQKYQGAHKPINQQGNFAPPHLTDLQPPEKVDEQLFNVESFTVFPLVLSYTSQEYADLFGTYSPQLAMPASKRREFLAKLKTLIDNDFDGHIRKHYGMTLTIAKRK